MARQLERLLAIDTLIRQAERQTANTLAAALEVSVRTIHHDLDFLRDRFHAPLTYSPTLGYPMFKSVCREKSGYEGLVKARVNWARILRKRSIVHVYWLA